jgi:hypothetical protein
MDVVEALADSTNSHTSAELARKCGIATSTCLPNWGGAGSSAYLRRYDQIEIHLGRTEGLTFDELDLALRSTQDRLAPGVA